MNIGMKKKKKVGIWGVGLNGTKKALKKVRIMNRVKMANKNHRYLKNKTLVNYQ